MAWSWLQSAGASSATGTTVAATFTTSNCVSGSTLIAAVACSATSSTSISSVKDGAGNSFIQIGFASIAGQTEVALYALNTPAGDVGIKPTITATISNSNSSALCVAEVSGIVTSSTAAGFIDGTMGTLTGTTAGTTIGPPSYTSSASNEFLVYIYGDNGVGATWTDPTGYTGATAGPGSAGAATGTNSSNDDDIEIAYKNSTNGTETGQYTLGAASGINWCLLMVAFKLTAAGAPTPAQLLQRQPFKRRQTPQWPTPAPPAAVTVPAPLQLPPIRRRTLARAVVRGTAPFPGFVAVPAPHQPPYRPPRRTPARAYWSGSRPFSGFVAVPAPLQQPAPAPRRRPARAYVQFTPVRTTNPAGPTINGTLQPLMTVPIPRRRPYRRAFIQFTPVTTTNPTPYHPPSGVVFGGQSAGGDRDPEIRMFRSVMPGEIPVSGSALPKLHGRGYAAPPPSRAEDVEVLWEAPPEPAEPPGPGAAEIALRGAQGAVSGLYDLGRIIAPEPYVPPAKARCGAIRKLGVETLRCSKKRGHPGMHSDRGVRWG